MDTRNIRFWIAILFALLSGFAIGQIAMPISAVLIVPNREKVDLSLVNQLLFNGYERDVQEWAKSNRFEYVKIAERKAALIHHDILYTRVISWQTLFEIFKEIESTGVPFVLRPDDKRTQTILPLLYRPNESVVLEPRLKSLLPRLNRDVAIAIQPYEICVAEVDIGGQIYEVGLQELSRPFQWDGLPKPTELPPPPSKEKVAGEEAGLSLQVVVVDFVLTDTEKAELTAQAFNKLAEMVQKQKEKEAELLGNWMKSIASKAYDERLLNWNSWNQLPFEIQEKILERADLKERLSEVGALDRVRVRVKGVGGVKIGMRGEFKTPPLTEILYIISFFGQPVFMTDGDSARALKI